MRTSATARVTSAKNATARQYFITFPYRNNIDFSVGRNASSLLSDQINTLKKALKQEKKEKRLSSINRRTVVESCDRRKRGLETALAHEENVFLPSNETPSRFISSFNPVSLGTASISKHCEEREFRAKIAQNGLPMLSSYYVYMLQKHLTKFAQFYV